MWVFNIFKKSEGGQEETLEVERATNGENLEIKSKPFVQRYNVQQKTILLKKVINIFVKSQQSNRKKGKSSKTRLQLITKTWLYIIAN